MNAASQPAEKDGEDQEVKRDIAKEEKWGGSGTRGGGIQLRKALINIDQFMMPQARIQLPS